MPPVGFEPTISAGERPKNYALDRAATGIECYEKLDKKLTQFNLDEFRIKLKGILFEGVSWKSPAGCAEPKEV